MKWNAVVAVGALIAVTLVGIVSLNGRSTQAADPPKPAGEIGRYQLSPRKNDVQRDVFFLFDTTNGCVYKESNGKWVEDVAAVKPK